MKKLFLLMFILMVGAGMAYSQSITVDNPHSGSVWCKGANYEIQWTTIGVMHSRVKLRLYSSTGTKILGIVNDTENDGSYHWTVPMFVKPGKYVIRVKTIDGIVMGNSSVFVIKSCGPGLFVYQGKLPILGMSKAELAIYMKGPGPRIRNFGRLKNLMAKYGMKTPFMVLLLRDGKSFLNLGTFKPTIGRRGKVFFNTIPDVLKLKLTREQQVMPKSGKNFTLILMTNGKAFAKTKIGVIGKMLDKSKQKRLIK